jgi:hypothetical protein
VGAENGHDNEQKAERGSPRGDPIRAWAHALDRTRTRTPARDACGGRGALDQHQTPSGSDFAHTATRGGDGRCAGVGGSPNRSPILAGTATLDPLAHILDVGPPGAGLGSSWHQRAILTARAAADDAS